MLKPKKVTLMDHNEKFKYLTSNHKIKFYTYIIILIIFGWCDIHVII